LPSLKVLPPGIRFGRPWLGGYGHPVDGSFDDDLIGPDARNRDLDHIRIAASVLVNVRGQL
jgi:hypothetical protein